MLEVLLNLLILACSSVSYSSTGGYTGITSLGGIYYYQYGGAYSGFDGADGEKAQQLDVQFYQLKLPMVTVAMAYSGALMAFCCLLIAMGVLRVPWHCPLWLVIEALLDVLIAGAYIPALYNFSPFQASPRNQPGSLDCSSEFPWGEVSNWPGLGQVWSSGLWLGGHSHIIQSYHLACPCE